MKLKRTSLIAGIIVLALTFGAGALWWPGSSARLPEGSRGSARDAQSGNPPLQTSTGAENPGSDASSSDTDAKPARTVAPTTQTNLASSLRPQSITEDGSVYPVRPYMALAAPNDPYAAQWWVSQTKMDQAWDIPAGSEQTVLAIIDTGFALGHEEFAGRWFANSGETGPAATEAPSSLNCTARGLPLSAACNLMDDDGDGAVDDETGSAVYENPSRLNCTGQGKPLDKSCNRIDDDSNGFVDDLTGWDFANGDNLPQAGELNPAGAGTTHGTRVAGIAAATGNNGKGIAGSDWRTRILPIQAMDDDEYGDSIGVARSIEYAVAMGADIISLSLGSDAPDTYVRNALQAALAAGIPVVAAAGNDGCDCMVYPAAYPEAFAVGALAADGQPTGFSSYGANLDILAPGAGLTSTSWQQANPTAAYVSGIAGTSYAAPMVAGLLSKLKSWQPAATPAQLTAAATETINRLSLPVQPLRSQRHGFGTLDAGKAANRMTAPRSGQILYAFSAVSRGGTLTPASPAEPAGNTFTYACEDGAWPSTPVLELTKGEIRFYTLSQAENDKAAQAGYVSNLLLYACLRQPHDSGSTMRSLNIYKEFRNMDYKGITGL